MIALIADLSEYVGLEDFEVRNTMGPVENFEFNGVLESSISSQLDGRLELTENNIQGVGSYMHPLLKYSPEDVGQSQVKNSFLTIISELHHKQITEDKYAILIVKESSVIFIHYRDEEGTIYNSDKDQISSGDRIDSDTVLSCCIIEPSSDPNIDFKARITDNSTIKDIFTDPTQRKSDISDNTSVTINCSRIEDSVDYNAEIEFKQDHFERLLTKESISFDSSDRIELITSGGSEVYEFDSAEYMGEKTQSYKNFKRKCYLDIKYDSLLIKRRYESKISKYNSFRESYTTIKRNGKKVDSKKLNKDQPEIIYSSERNNGEPTQKLANKIINKTIRSTETSIYFPSFKYKLDPLCLEVESGNNLVFLNVDNSLISETQKEVLEEIYKRVVDLGKDKLLKQTYAISLYKLVSLFISKRESDISDSVDSVISKYSLSSESTQIDYPEDSLIDYKLGVKILNDSEPPIGNNQRHNKNNIVGECSNKLSNSNKNTKLILWGISDAGKVVGLDSDNVEKHIQNKPNDSQSGFTLEGNLEPSSDYMGDLKNRLESDPEINSAEVFKLKTDSGKVLAILLNQGDMSHNQTQLPT